MGGSTLATKAREAHLALHTEGVTFTVYTDDDEGIERVWPFDLLPRIIPAAEWAHARGGAEAARTRAEPLPERPLPRPAHPEGRRGARRS